VVTASTATFTSARANYTITRTASGYTVVDNVGTEGTTSVPSGVQSMVFTDVTLNLQVAQKAASLSAADLKSLTELYVAYFNRVPDADGLSYWIDQFKAGQTIEQIGQQFYSSALQYSSLTGYTSAMSNADFITLVYKNVLGRSPPDAAGLAYWTTSLANGSQTRGTLVNTILAAAHGYKGDATFGYVADLLDNKNTVANYFAVQLGLNYTTASDSITKGMAIAAAVTATNTTAAIGLISVAAIGTGASTVASLSGYFVDAPVSGLVYVATPSGVTGTTDLQGGFSYKPGDSVAFSAAGVSVGSAAPQLATDGSVVVTPLSLTGEPAANAPKALSIARLLNTLNGVSVAKGQGSSGAFIVPTDAGLITRLAATGQTAAAMTGSVLQSALDGAFGAGLYRVSSDADSQTGLLQGAGSVGVAGTVWRANCLPSCGGATMYFKTNGEVAGFTDDAGLLSGSWVVSTSGSGQVSLNLLSSGGGTASGSIASSASGGTLTLISTNGATPPLAMVKLAATSTPSTSYNGLWFGAFTPNSSGTANGLIAGTAYIIASPDGKIYGIDDSSKLFSGSWTPSTGQGTATKVVSAGVGGGTLLLDLAARTGSLIVNGVTQGSTVFGRDGVLSTQNGASTSAPTLSLVLNLVSTWRNLPTSASSYALDAQADTAAGARVGSVVKPVSTAFSTSGRASSTSDTITLYYPGGSAASYKVTFGDGSASKDGCTISNGTAPVTDANSGKPAAYATVTVNC
jgi:hypothetical protein